MPDALRSTPTVPSPASERSARIVRLPPPAFGGDLRPAPVAVRGLADRLSRHGVLVSFLALVLLPTLLTALYLVAFASNQYQVEFRAAVRMAEAGGSPVSTGLLSLGLSGIAAPTENDSNALVQFLRSRSAVDRLQETIDLRMRFEDSRWDYVFRLKAGQPVERLVDYWSSMTSFYYEQTTGTVIGRVFAFTPQDALAIATRSLALSEAFVNEMSERSRTDLVGYAQRQVETALDRVSFLDEQMKDLRNRERVLDPNASAMATEQLSLKLLEDISAVKSELGAVAGSLSKESPRVAFLSRRLEALEAERRRIAAGLTDDGTAGARSGTGQPISNMIGAFEKLERERHFAEMTYQSALASLEQAHLQANRQQIYLATIVQPALPEEEAFPRRLRDTFVVFVLLSGLWVVGLLAVYGVREHL